MKVQKTKKAETNTHQIQLFEAVKNIPPGILKKEELNYIKAETEGKSNENSIVTINRYTHKLYFVFIKKAINDLIIEEIRVLGSQLALSLNTSEKAVLINHSSVPCGMALIEGLVLGSYGFFKYFKNAKDLKSKLIQLDVLDDKITETQLSDLVNTCEGTYLARDLVNEPLSFLTAEQLSKETQIASKKAGFKLEVLNKKQIESLNMGGLLAVNKGAVEPPTFNILEYKPKNAKNSKPLVFVGKGVVYDTGGLSLKPTAGSMDEMKSDMGGAAAVIGAIYSIAKNKWPVHVVGLIPATENRPGGNAYAPGDVVKMYNGLNVEVLNTDAEGRMILADALTYAKKYKPELVLDLATLTGAAHRAVGTHASVVMGTAAPKYFLKLKKAGEKSFERVVEFPFWDEYRNQIKSHVADIKNIGGALGGAITAGKFLEYFTQDDKRKPFYPWIHIDIAGPAFLSANEGYRPKGGSGVGVRLLVELAKEYAF